jgi:hypothetical protein
MRIWRGPNVWRLDRLLSVPQIDLSARADRKMVIFYVYLRYFTKKSRLYRTDTQIKKIFGVQRKNLRTPSYAYLRICIFSKEITALEYLLSFKLHKLQGSGSRTDEHPPSLRPRKRNPACVDSKCRTYIKTDGTTGSSERMIWRPALDK